MSHVDPATWTQLIVALSTLFVAVAGWLKSQSNGKKIDDNTTLTSDIHKVTNGPLTEMGQHVITLGVQAATNAATAAATAEAAKVQAAVDAAPSVQPLEKTT